MEQSNFDLVLEAFRDNNPYCSESGQKRDVDLICDLLWLKYNFIEIKDISQLLITKINRCIAGEESWFTNY